jgi:transcriptional regulator with XRE-family HTH domain
MPISAQLRDAIKSAGLSLRQLAKETGVAHPVLSHFLSDDPDIHRDIRIERTADKLAEYFGLELAPSRARLSSSSAKPTNKSKTAKKSSSTQPKKKRRGIVQRLSPEEMAVEIKKVERKRAGRDLRIARTD